MGQRRVKAVSFEILSVLKLDPIEQIRRCVHAGPSWWRGAGVNDDDMMVPDSEELTEPDNNIIKKIFEHFFKPKGADSALIINVKLPIH